MTLYESSRGMRGRKFENFHKSYFLKGLTIFYIPPIFGHIWALQTAFLVDRFGCPCSIVRLHTERCRQIRILYIQDTYHSSTTLPMEFSSHFWKDSVPWGTQYYPYFICPLFASFLKSRTTALLGRINLVSSITNFQCQQNINPLKYKYNKQLAQVQWPKNLPRVYSIEVVHQL